MTATTSTSALLTSSLVRRSSLFASPLGAAWEEPARQNVAASPHAGRVHLAELDVTDLDPGPRYTLVWLPTMFMTRSVVARAIDRIHAASCNGAWLVAALYTTPDDPFAAAMAKLRTLRGGGEVTDPMDLAEMLRSIGYVDVEVDAAPLATFVLGRLP